MPHLGELAGEVQELAKDVAAGGGGSSGGSANVGAAVVDFGAFPGKTDASVTVTGQAGILSTSTVQAWIAPKATAEHSEDEHIAEESLAVFVPASGITAATGFVIKAHATGRQRIYGRWNLGWNWS